MTNQEILTVPCDVLGVAEKHRVNMRTAAMIRGIGRIAEAKRRRGIFL